MGGRSHLHLRRANVLRINTNRKRRGGRARGFCLCGRPTHEVTRQVRLYDPAFQPVWEWPHNCCSIDRYATRADSDSPVIRYTKLGFGGAQTDSNQRLMYTWA